MFAPKISCFVILYFLLICEIVSIILKNWSTVIVSFFVVLLFNSFIILSNCFISFFDCLSICFVRLSGLFGFSAYRSAIEFIKFSLFLLPTPSLYPLFCKYFLNDFTLLFNVECEPSNFPIL